MNTTLAKKRRTRAIRRQRAQISTIKNVGKSIFQTTRKNISWLNKQYSKGITAASKVAQIVEPIKHVLPQYYIPLSTAAALGRRWNKPYGKTYRKFNKTYTSYRPYRPYRHYYTRYRRRRFPFYRRRYTRRTRRRRYTYEYYA